MANKNQGLFIIAIVIGIAAFILLPRLGLFAILPEGQSNTYGDCVFTTNVEPVESRYGVSFPDGYYQIGAWVAIDYNNDGTLDPFIWNGRDTISNSDNPTLLVENYNSEGDDVYHYVDGSGVNRLYLTSSLGVMGSTYTENIPEEISPITTCIPPGQCPVTSGSECDSCELGIQVMDGWQTGDNDCTQTTVMECINSLNTNYPAEADRILGTGAPRSCAPKIDACPVTTGAECNTCEGAIGILNGFDDGTNDCTQDEITTCLNALNDYPVESIRVSDTNPKICLPVENQVSNTVITLVEIQHAFNSVTIEVNWDNPTPPDYLDIEWGQGSHITDDIYNQDSLQYAFTYGSPGIYTITACVADFEGGTNACDQLDITILENQTVTPCPITNCVTCEDIELTYIEWNDLGTCDILNYNDCRTEVSLADAEELERWGGSGNPVCLDLTSTTETTNGTEQTTTGDSLEGGFDFQSFFDQYKWWIIGIVGGLLLILLFKK